MNATAQQWLGSSFINPWWDYLLIGSLWSIIVTIALWLLPGAASSLDVTSLVVLVLVVNSAHFAASTIRLYSNPANFSTHPFLTLGLPLLMLLVLGLCILLPLDLGRHWQALYLTWSPYHYAAQTFGLSMMYCRRSGLNIDMLSRRMMYWICLLPFLRAFLGAPSSGLGWFVSRDTIAQVPGAMATLGVITDLLTWGTFLLPIVLAVYFIRQKRTVFPLIAICMMVANGMWWIMLDFVDAFIIATIAHGIQYLAIALIFHVRENGNKEGNTRSTLALVTQFYGKSLVLGYLLFYCWPYAFVFAGAGLAESMLLVIATINIHHFIVDRYIWRAPKAPAAGGQQANRQASVA